MITSRTTLARRVTAALDASPSRIPVLLGGCGTGRTTLLHQLRERFGRTSTQYIDVERTATTPERLLRAIVATSPFPVSDQSRPGARASFDATLATLGRARTGADGPGPAAARDRRDLALPGQRPVAARRARLVRRHARVLRARPHRGERAGDLPARRVPGAADLRELPRPAPRALRLHRRCRREP